MDEDDLIAAWRRLPTSQSRGKAIEAFLQELDPYQWRHVHAITSQRSFKTDIIGQLPVELVAEIFAYLDSSTPYQLQRVCRRWHEILQSPVIARSRDLLEWYHGARDLSDANYTLCTQAAKDKHAFRHGGRPSLALQVKTGTGVASNHLVGDTLVWLPDIHYLARSSNLPVSAYHQRAMYMLNLRTWHLKILTGEARENILATFASEQLVGFTTRTNICYVFDLLTGERRKFRVKNAAMLQAVACRERTVVCAGYELDHVLVYIWDYDTQVGKSFTVHAASAAANKFMNHFPNCSKAYTLALLPQPRTQSVVVFISTCSHCSFQELQRQSHTAPTIQYHTLDYDGVEVRGVSAIELHPLATALFYPPYFGGFVPVDTKGSFRVGITGESFAQTRRLAMTTLAVPEEDHMRTHFLQFDEQTHTFTRPRQDLHGFTSRSTFWWNETFFKCSDSRPRYDHDPHIEDLLVYAGTAETHCSKTFIRQLSRDGAPVPRVRHLNLVNHTYVIRVCDEGFQVLCYDSNHARPDIDMMNSDVAKLDLIEEGKKEWDFWS